MAEYNVADFKVEYRKVWDFLISQGLSKEGTAGLMGNLYAESGLDPGNLQNSHENKLSYTDGEYTEAVDSGTYLKGKFISDSAGYGLAQWTYSTRKRGLYEATVEMGTSVGDMDAQLDFLADEMRTDYPSVWKKLKSADSIREASDLVLTKYERPADQSERQKEKRASYGQCFYNLYA